MIAHDDNKGEKTREFSEAETARRRDEIILNMIATPPQKHEPLNPRPPKKRKPKR